MASRSNGFQRGRAGNPGDPCGKDLLRYLLRTQHEGTCGMGFYDYNHFRIYRVPPESIVAQTVEATRIAIECRTTGDYPGGVCFLVVRALDW
jgi:hypothetical protein